MKVQILIYKGDKITFSNVLREELNKTIDKPIQIRVK